MDLIELVRQVKDGEICPLKVLAELRSLQNEIESAIDLIKPECFAEIDRYLSGKDKKVKLYGFTFGVTQSGTYSYKHAKVWLSKENELKSIQEKMKIALQQGGTYIDTETGEIFPAAEYTPSEKSISVSSKK